MSKKRAYEDRPYRNYEGYSDPTAYLAIRNCSGERLVRHTTLIIIEEERKKKRKHSRHRNKRPVNK